MADIKAEVNSNPDLSVNIDLNAKLKTELETVKNRAKELDTQLQSAQRTISRLTDELNDAKMGAGISELEERIEMLTRTTGQAEEEFRAFLMNAQMLEYAFNSWDAYEFRDIFNDISEGAITSAQAIAQVKSQWSDLVKAGSGQSGDIDSQILSTLTATINSMSKAVDSLHNKIDDLIENGIRTIGNGGGSSEAVGSFEELKNTIDGMAESAGGAYEPLTNLIKAVESYANIDNAKLFAVSQAISGLGEIGKGNYSAKSVENTINLVTRLQGLTSGGNGSIDFHISGLESFSNLTIRKASLNNLATYLPQIASVDASKLERISHIDLSRFNNLNINKSSMNNLAQLLNSINSEVNTNWVDNVVNSINEVKVAVDSLKDSLNEIGGARSGVTVDSSDFDGLKNLLSDINNILQNTNASNAVEQMNRLGEATKQVTVYLGRYDNQLTELGQLKDSLTGLGFQENDIIKITEYLSDNNIKVKEVIPIWEKAGVDGVRRLKEITVVGVNAANSIFRETLKIDKKTGEIASVTTKANIKAKELKEEMKGVGDAAKDIDIDITEAELKEIDGLLEEIKVTNRSLTSSYKSVTDALGGVSATGVNGDEFDRIRNKYVELMNATEQLRANRLTATQEDIDNVRRLQAELDKLIRQSNERIGIKPTFDVQKAEDGIKSIRDRLNGLVEPSKEATDRVNAVIIAFDNFNKATDSSAKAQAFTELTRAIQAAERELSILEGREKNQQRDANKLFDRQKAEDDINDIESRYSRLSSKTDDVTDRVNKLRWALDAFDTAPDSESRTRAFKLLNQYIQAAKRSLVDLEAEQKKQESNSKKESYKVFDVQKAVDGIEEVKSKFSKLKDQPEEVKKSIEELDKAFEDFNNAPTLDDKTKAFTILNNKIGAVERSVTKLTNAEKESQRSSNRTQKEQERDATKANRQRQAALKLIQQISQAEKEWTKAKRGSTASDYSNLHIYNQELRELIQQYDSGKIPAKQFSEEVNRIKNRFGESAAAIKNAGENVYSMSSRFGSLTEKFMTWFSASRIIMSAYNNMRKMISASIELDKVMNQLQVVTKDNDKTMAQFGSTAADTAKRIGSSITDFVTSSTTYARLGYNLEESAKLAEYTAMLQNVGDIDVSDAQEAITSIVKAFNIGTDQIESVMDKMVIAGNNFPISVSDIAEGMKNASSALAAAGNRFDQSVALLTAANTTINLCRVA